MEVLYYNGYKKLHARKLSVICCIFTAKVLHVAVARGRVSDPSAFCHLQKDLIHPNARLLGDKAYIGEACGAICPYKENEIEVQRARVQSNVPGAAAHLLFMENFNKQHSHFRLHVERGIGSICEFAAAQGRSDARMCHNYDDITMRIEVCAALVNWRSELRAAMMCGDVTL